MYESADKTANERPIHDDMVKTIVHVSTGEVMACRQDLVLQSSGIGSCVVICACDGSNETGGLAHVMLPGAAPESATEARTRYAFDAIREMLGRMKRLGANRRRIEICLVGGGNVLKRENDSIGASNVASIEMQLAELGLPIVKKAVGGVERRAVRLDIGRGCVEITEGDSAWNMFWKSRPAFQKIERS